MRNKEDFTKHEIEIAIRVIMKSLRIKHWVEAEARTYKVDLDTAEGKAFYELTARAAAEKDIEVYTFYRISASL